jgi:hypothetical protein
MAALALLGSSLSPVGADSAFCVKANSDTPAFHYFDTPGPVAQVAALAELESAGVAVGMDMVKHGDATIPKLRKAMIKQATLDGQLREILIAANPDKLVIPPSAGGMPDLQRSYVRKNMFHGEDFMLENLQAMPDPEDLYEATEDEDAIALQNRLRELANRDVADLSYKTILPVVPAYGVGATVSSLIYPVLEGLATGSTVFAPAMLNWTSPTCKERDLSCYFSSLPSLPKRTEALLNEKHKRDLKKMLGATNMLAKLHGPTPDDTTETMCKTVHMLGVGCPQIRRATNRYDQQYHRHDASNGVSIRWAKTVNFQALADPWVNEGGKLLEAVVAENALLPRDIDAMAVNEFKFEPLSLNDMPADVRGMTDDQIRSGIAASKEHVNAAQISYDVSEEVLKTETPMDRLVRAMTHPMGIHRLKQKNVAPLGIKHGFFNLTNGFSIYDESDLVSRLDKRWLKRGRFWLMSQIIKFITTPNKRMMKKLDERREQVGEMEEPVLGLHVRRGDACGDRGECRSLKDYIPTISDMINKYDYKTVFLATPDPYVIEEVQKYPNITFAFLPVTNTTEMMKKEHYRKIDDAIYAGKVDAGNEFDEAMISYYLLSEADGFVGGFSSNAARIAYSMMAAGPTGCIKPFDSFDLNWCAAFGKGGGQVLRRGNQSCLAAKEAGHHNLPCMIGC